MRIYELQAPEEASLPIPNGSEVMVERSLGDICNIRAVVGSLRAENVPTVWLFALGDTPSLIDRSREDDDDVGFSEEYIPQALRNEEEVDPKSHSYAPGEKASDVADFLEDEKGHRLSEYYDSILSNVAFVRTLPDVEEGECPVCGTGSVADFLFVGKTAMFNVLRHRCGAMVRIGKNVSYNYDTDKKWEGAGHQTGELIEKSIGEEIEDVKAVVAHAELLRARGNEALASRLFEGCRIRLQELGVE